jgi:hypothetical protein
MERGQWEYDRFGNVTLMWPDGKSVFIQGEDGANAFLEGIGLKPEEVCPGDWDIIPEAVEGDYYEIAE